jgi:hypothetical protein
MTDNASGTKPKLGTGDRLIMAAVLGGWGAFIAYFSMASHPQHLAKDFSYPWRAARALLAGQNPYEVMRAVGEYPFNSGLLYPLPAAIVATPFANLRPEIAGAIFVGLSSALLGEARDKVGGEKDHTLAYTYWEKRDRKPAAE